MRLAVVCAALLYGSAVYAQDAQLCESVLRVSPTQQGISYRYLSEAGAYLDLFCRQRFTDYTQASSFAGRAGLSVPLLDGLFSFSAGARSNSSSFKSEYDSQCSRIQSASGREERLLDLKQTYDSSIYQTWLGCVDIVAGQKPMFVFVSPQDDTGQRWLVNFRFKLQSFRPIKILSILPSTLRCELGGGGAVESREITSSSFAIECEKAGPSTLRATFQTSEGTVQNVEIPGVQLETDVQRLERRLAPGLVPKGAILSFEARTCPSGWRAYPQAQGRFVLGLTPELGVGFGKLSVDQPSGTGGAESARLTMNNIPAHQHATQGGVQRGNAIWGDSGLMSVIFGTQMGQAYASNTSPAGKSPPDPIDTFPPYVALLYCVKE